MMLGVVITMWKGFCGFVPTLQGRLQNCFIGVVIMKATKNTGVEHQKQSSAGAQRRGGADDGKL